MGSELRVRGGEVVDKVRKGSQVDVGITQGQEPERAGTARGTFLYQAQLTHHESSLCLVVNKTGVHTA